MLAFGTSASCTNSLLASLGVFDFRGMPHLHFGVTSLAGESGASINLTLGGQRLVYTGPQAAALVHDALVRSAPIGQRSFRAALR